MNTPLVSVNITTYNRAKELIVCLKAVLDQTYKNIEIIIVDDCSSDETIIVMQNYLMQYPSIKYIRHKRNRGLAHARNTAWKNSRGEFIAFLDDDDLWIDPEKLEKQVSLFKMDQSGKVAVVCSNAKVKNYNGHFYYHKVDFKGDMKKALLASNGIVFTSTALARREVLERVGGFDTKLKRGIDSDFYRQCVVVFNYTITCIPDITVEYSELGNDRISLQNTQKALFRVISANAYLIQKYFFYYFKYPSVFIHRMDNIYYAGKNILIKKM